MRPPDPLHLREETVYKEDFYTTEPRVVLLEITRQTYLAVSVAVLGDPKQLEKINRAAANDMSSKHGRTQGDLIVIEILDERILYRQ